MNPLTREYLLLWLRIRAAYWRWVLDNIDPCHEDVPLVMRTAWTINDRIDALERARGTT